MKLTELLERHQQVHLAIFYQLLASDGAISIKQLEQTLAISSPTLQKEIRALDEEIQSYDSKSFLQRLPNERLTVRLSNTFRLKEFIYSYAQQAQDYRILHFIFQHKNVSITKMTIDLQMSESSIFRRLKSINQLLQEYDIQFRNKQLIGSESQIRIFFYHLFEVSLPLTAIDTLFTNPMIFNLIHVIEKHFFLSLSTKQRSQLILWFSIMQNRLDYRGKQAFDLSSETIRDVEQDSFYRELKVILARYLSRFAIFWSDEEAVFLYLFFLSEGLVPLTPKRLDESPFITKFFAINSSIYHVLTEQDDVDSFQTFLLNLHVKLTFYKGWIEAQENKFLLLSDSDAEKMSRCMSIIEENISLEISDSQWKLVDEMYGLVYDIYQRRQTKKVMVGIVLDDSLESEEWFQFIQQHLVGIPHLTIERAGRVNYSLLLVTEFSEVANYQYEDVFFLTGQLSLFEVNRLKTAIQKMFT